MNHDYCMGRALELAKKGRTSPNPMVGCVIVRGSEIVGEGFHSKAGAPHAEVLALRAAGEKASGATAYVTLEPCSHYGRTPPCADALIAAGVSEVYVGMLDPDERVSGKGVEKLNEAGIRVHLLHSMEAFCQKLNEPYIKHRKTGLPYVSFKSAMSLDGKIASETGDSKWITGEIARKYSHKFRAQVDAIIVGANTVRVDNPALSARIGKQTYYPKRVVVTGSGQLDSTFNIFNQPGETIIATGRECGLGQITELELLGARILQIEYKNGLLLMEDLLQKLGKLGVLSVLVEGGGKLGASFFQEQLVDRAMFYYAPKIIGGGASASAVGGFGVEEVNLAPRLVDIKRRKLGDDLLVEGRVEYH